MKGAVFQRDVRRYSPLCASDGSQRELVQAIYVESALCAAQRTSFLHSNQCMAKVFMSRHANNMLVAYVASSRVAGELRRQSAYCVVPRLRAVVACSLVHKCEVTEVLCGCLKRTGEDSQRKLMQVEAHEKDNGADPHLVKVVWQRGMGTLGHVCDQACGTQYKVVSRTHVTSSRVVGGLQRHQQLIMFDVWLWLAGPCTDVKRSMSEAFRSRRLAPCLFRAVVACSLVHKCEVCPVYGVP
ncbi:hypothetical protein Efla_001403 [Eimeria flavescens]